MMKKFAVLHCFPRLRIVLCSGFRIMHTADRWPCTASGPDDGRTLCSNAALYHHSSEQLFKGIIDLQTLLSSRVKRHNEVFQKTHSLESLKLIYRIKGDVNHNALSDAYDLCRIHEAYRKETELDNDAIEQIYRGMETKTAGGGAEKKGPPDETSLRAFCRSA